MRMTKNKIRTPSYFVKRLRDNGFVVIKMFQEFSKTDNRAWTILVNPGAGSVFITCYFNRLNINDVEFEFNDGGANIPKNFFIKTDSIEVIIEYLINHNVSNRADWPLKQKFLRPRINNLNGTDTQQPASGQESGKESEQKSQL